MAATVIKFSAHLKTNFEEVEYSLKSQKKNYITLPGAYFFLKVQSYIVTWGNYWIFRYFIYAASWIEFSFLRLSTCMCECMCVYIYIYIYIYVCVYIYICMCLRTYLSTYVCVYTKLTSPPMTLFRAKLETTTLWDKINIFKNPNWQEADQLDTYKVQNRSWTVTLREPRTNPVSRKVSGGLEPLEHQITSSHHSATLPPHLNRPHESFPVENRYFVCARRQTKEWSLENAGPLGNKSETEYRPSKCCFMIDLFLIQGINWRRIKWTEQLPSLWGYSWTV